MGTPAIAVGCLEATVAWADRVRVVTQPDRPQGRSGQPQPSPVKSRALELGLEVVQPERLRRDEAFLAWLRAEPVDVAVVVAFGQILPPEVLATPRLGCVNVHFSRLPKYRGAAPVQRALIAGEPVTAVATMMMDEGLDTGPVLLTQEVAIGAAETAGELLDRLAALAPEVLTRTLEELAAGRLTAVAQDHAAATLAPRLTKDDGRLDWTWPAPVLVNRVRGVTPWPGATAEVAGEVVKVLAAGPGEGTGPPGAVLAIRDGQGILVATGEGAVWVRQVQAPGRKAVPAEAYARGRRLPTDDAGSQTRSA